MSDDTLPEAIPQIPDTNDIMSDFARRSRELGRRLKRLELDYAREQVLPEHREELRQWIKDARDHTPDPEAFDVGLVGDDRPMDYAMLSNIFRQQSELVRHLD
jgi:hypothetical protein